MADYNNTAVSRSTTDVIDMGLRAYMQRVYNYMFLGLLITGAVAYGTYMLSVTSDPAQAVGHFKNGVMVTQFGQVLFGSPLQWVVVFSPLVLVMLFQRQLPRLSFGAAQACFFGFAALLGVSMATIFIAYTMTSIAMVFFITAAMFAGMSLWGYTTKSDLSGWGSFLIMGVWGIVVASVVNIFLHSQMLSFVFSAAGVVVFTGITAYYSQTIKEMYSANDDGTVSGRKAIYGALVLYISFINLFTSLLRLFGGRR